MLMGIYLFVIAIQDLRYREVYHLYSHEWASSLGCTAIGIMAMISTEVQFAHFQIQTEQLCKFFWK